jgi:hypothetical protein
MIPWPGCSQSSADAVENHGHSRQRPNIVVSARLCPTQPSKEELPNHACNLVDPSLTGLHRTAEIMCLNFHSDTWCENRNDLRGLRVAQRPTPISLQGSSVLSCTGIQLFGLRCYSSTLSSKGKLARLGPGLAYPIDARWVLVSTLSGRATGCFLVTITRHLTRGLEDYQIPMPQSDTFLSRVAISFPTW